VSLKKTDAALHRKKDFRWRLLSLLRGPRRETGGLGEAIGVKIALGGGQSRWEEVPRCEDPWCLKLGIEFLGPVASA
jgi:hypothetical protein